MLLCDHASNAVPPGIDLQIDPALLDKHIAIDIGSAALTRSLALACAAPAVLATVSRLVIDLNREVDNLGLVPLESDGHAIPGNRAAETIARVRDLHAPYHRTIAAMIREHRPTLLVAVHSFTPALENSDAAPRPWEAGILYNRDTRAAHLAIALLRARGIETGDNEPYSGRVLNATLNRHGEGNGIPSMALEIRNDLIPDDAAVARWRDILAPMLTEIGNGLARNASSAT